VLGLIEEYVGDIIASPVLRLAEGAGVRSPKPIATFDRDFAKLDGAQHLR
jgi:hypothetical protein